MNNLQKNKPILKNKKFVNKIKYSAEDASEVEDVLINKNQNELTEEEQNAVNKRSEELTNKLREKIKKDKPIKQKTKRRKFSDTSGEKNITVKSIILSGAVLAFAFLMFSLFLIIATAGKPLNAQMYLNDNASCYYYVEGEGVGYSETMPIPVSILTGSVADEAYMQNYEYLKIGFKETLGTVKIKKITFSIKAGESGDLKLEFTLYNAYTGKVDSVFKIDQAVTENQVYTFEWSTRATLPLGWADDNNPTHIYIQQGFVDSNPEIAFNLYNIKLFK